MMKILALATVVAGGSLGGSASLNALEAPDIGQEPLEVVSYHSRSEFACRVRWKSLSVTKATAQPQRLGNGFLLYQQSERTRDIFEVDVDTFISSLGADMGIPISMKCDSPTRDRLILSLEPESGKLQVLTPAQHPYESAQLVLRQVEAAWPQVYGWPRHEVPPEEVCYYLVKRDELTGQMQPAGLGFLKIDFEGQLTFTPYATRDRKPDLARKAPFLMARDSQGRILLWFEEPQPIFL